MLKAFIKRHFWSILIVFFVCLNLFLAQSFFDLEVFNFNDRKMDSISFNQDLDSFRNKNFKTFKDVSGYFTKLAEDKGAVYAYELLKIAPIPTNMDLHLLGHTIGEVLYKQEGAKGIYKCTQDFRNACSHTIVVGLLFEKGEQALDEMVDICKNAPGGSGAYTMCFHGLGHGVLAYNDYNLEKTVKMCVGLKTLDGYSGREISECIGGSIMEIISGGFHDKDAWEKQKLKYFSKDDPLMPCSSGFMPEEGKSVCYTYLTPHLFQSAGADLNRPSPKTFGKAFNFCNKIPVKDVGSRMACYGGFGKEFIVLAKNRDIRNMNNFTQEELSKVHEWCNLSENKDGVEFCTNSAVSSLFWGGENDPQVSVDFCSLAPDTLRQSCFQALMGNAFQYLKSKDTLSNFCKMLKEPYKKECSQRLN